ncbi:MAG TPA: flagellar export protein FliJ [Pirellulales bacterium]|nr:flagellar export protein FliJ [Pirellulales bacterium]
MARFQFRLATLLRLRELARDERRAQLAEAMRLADQVRARQDDIGSLIDSTRKLQVPRPGALDVDELLNATRYELVLRAELRQLELQQATIETEIERRREALVAADRDVRSLELLRDAQQERHSAEEEQRSRKELDEVALRRYAVEPVE